MTSTHAHTLTVLVMVRNELKRIYSVQNELLEEEIQQHMNKRRFFVGPRFTREEAEQRVADCVGDDRLVKPWELYGSDVEKPLKALLRRCQIASKFGMATIALDEHEVKLFNKHF